MPSPANALTVGDIRKMPSFGLSIFHVGMGSGLPSKAETTTAALSCHRLSETIAYRLPKTIPMIPTVFVEGVFEEFDTAGEWFFDKRTRQLFFKPAAGIDLSQAQIEVNTTSKLLNISGTRDTPVHDILIEGIDFSHARDTSLEATETLASQ